MSRWDPQPDYTIDAATGCWVWQKATTQAGYPHGRAHRRYYTEHYGVTLAPETHVHHKCRNTSCVNPEHLEAVDARDHFKEHYLDEVAGITLEDVKAIRELGRKPGVRAEDVAEQYGIHWDTVNRYWRGEGWEFFLGDGGPCRPDPYPCARPGCTNLVVGRKRHARFCSPRCQHNRLAKVVEAVPVEGKQQP